MPYVFLTPSDVTITTAVSVPNAAATTPGLISYEQVNAQLPTYQAAVPGIIAGNAIAGNVPLAVVGTPGRVYVSQIAGNVPLGTAGTPGRFAVSYLVPTNLPLWTATVPGILSKEQLFATLSVEVDNVAGLIYVSHIPTNVPIATTSIAGRITLDQVAALVPTTISPAPRIGEVTLSGLSPIKDYVIISTGVSTLSLPRISDVWNTITYHNSASVGITLTSPTTEGIRGYDNGYVLPPAESALFVRHPSTNQWYLW